MSSEEKPGTEPHDENNGQRGLQRFLVIVVFASIALPALFAGALLIRENFQRTIDHDSQVATNNYADLLQAGMMMPLWNVAPSLGQPLIDTVKVDPSVLTIYVTGTDGEEFLKYTKKGKNVSDDSLTAKRSISYDGEVLGEVELTYSVAAARQRALGDSQLLLSILVVQLVTSIALLNYFLRARVITPLQQLEVSAAGIAGGDLKTSIPALKKDEFGALSFQLEKMRSSIEQSVTQLEERVRERTIELVDINKELHGTLERLQEAQDSLVQSEKLAALGSLVAGVAHELNTPIGNGLTVASSLRESSGRMKEMMQEGMTRTALESYIEDMDEGSHLVCASLSRASELVSSFKQVAVDRTSAHRREFGLLEMLNEMKLTLSPMYKHTPYEVIVSAPENVMLNSYPGPLGQIITNLINNSLIHGFDGKDHGKIEIIGSREGEGKAKLLIRDDGNGIKKENQSRIFDPFFTTKLGKGGNGLGMHIVHNIVTGVLGGTISLDSEEGKGTCFEIIIPLDSPSVASDIARDGKVST